MYSDVFRRSPENLRIHSNYGKFSDQNMTEDSYMFRCLFPNDLEYRHRQLSKVINKNRCSEKFEIFPEMQEQSSRGVSQKSLLWTFGQKLSREQIHILIKNYIFPYYNFTFTSTLKIFFTGFAHNFSLSLLIFEISRNNYFPEHLLQLPGTPSLKFFIKKF